MSATVARLWKRGKAITRLFGMLSARSGTGV